MDLLKVCCTCPQVWGAVLKGLHHALLVTDMKGVILFSSPLAEELFGMSHDELSGCELSSLFQPDDLDVLYPNLLHLARTRQSFEGELMLTRRDGAGFIVFLTMRPCYGTELDQPIIVFSIKDIENLKQVQKVVSKSHYEDLVKLASGIAHEIRNPLVGIGGFVKRLFKVCGDNPEAERYQHQIITNLQKIEGLVKKVEFFAQLPKPCFGEVNARELIDYALEPHAEHVEKQAATLSVEAEARTIRADKNLAARALSILFENALEALGESGTISIHTEAGESDFSIHVTDNGAGIATEDLPYIFNPFFSTKSTGTGIDLAIAKRIMEMHGGAVCVRSDSHAGATFSLRFPLERRHRLRVARMGSERERDQTRVS
jgi:PAS domain S-box-containing protein